ncbi:hypothetical protein E3N88_21436 [Mikania micrantha]|uniref:Uncharacterized protein n=1 Tax=Mikania micrantha TaxID=192012 RepID=A0A5N6NLN8_9ASTR|nr:hypothetical protein E3N88_21436 [Mikania micrantha]
MRDLLCLRGADAGRGWTSTNRLFYRRHFTKKRLRVLFLAQTWSHLFSSLSISSTSSSTSSQFVAPFTPAPSPTPKSSTADNHPFAISPSTATHPSRFPPPQLLLRDLPPRPPSPSSLRRDPSHPFVGRNPRSAVVVFNRWFVSLGFAISPTTALLHRRLGFGLRGFEIAGVRGDVDSGGLWRLNGRRGWTMRLQGFEIFFGGQWGWGRWVGKRFCLKRFLENKHHQKLFLQGFGPPLLQKKFADMVCRPQTFYL